jgi:CheY-like chemotaxis protein
MQKTRPILLVEDDQVDALTVKRILREVRIENHLEIVTDGEQALDYLRNADNPRPAFILLDLNMPRMDGIECLQILKNDDNLKSLPVIVITTSKGRHDIEDCFRLGVAGYMVKPIDNQKFVEIVTVINRYWTLSEVPS